MGLRPRKLTEAMKKVWPTNNGCIARRGAIFLEVVREGVRPLGYALFPMKRLEG